MRARRDCLSLFRSELLAIAQKASLLEASIRFASRIHDVLQLVSDSARSLFERECEFFAPDPPRFRFVSPIADGADQIAAEVALELGWELQVVLPFARSEYRSTLANHGARESFDALACPGELRP